MTQSLEAQGMTASWGNKAQNSEVVQGVDHLTTAAITATGEKHGTTALLTLPYDLFQRQGYGGIDHGGPFKVEHMPNCRTMSLAEQ